MPLLRDLLRDLRPLGDLERLLLVDLLLDLRRLLRDQLRDLDLRDVYRSLLDLREADRDLDRSLGLLQKTSSILHNPLDGCWM